MPDFLPPTSPGADPPEATAPPFWQDRRMIAAAAISVVVLVASVAMMRGRPQVDEDLLMREAAAQRTAWSAYRRQAPTALAGGFVEGALEPGDEAGGSARYEDYYAYEHADSSTFTIVVTAEGFVPDLLVDAPDGRRIAASMLRQTAHRAEVPGLRAPGRYVITVTAREPGAGGAYELSAGRPPSVEAVEVGRETIEGKLGRAGTLRAARFENHYALAVRPGEPVVVTLSAKTFRPRAVLLGPEGEVVPPWITLERQDTDTTHAVILRYRPGWDEPYTLIVSSEERGARGDYVLETEALRVPVIRTDGRGVGGTLGERSWLREGRYVDSYRFSADAGARVYIEVYSSAFTPEVILMRGERPIATARGGRAATLDREVDADGTFTVEVTSTDEGATGDYTLIVAVDGAEGPRTQSFRPDITREGTTRRGHSFAVTIDRVTVEPAGDHHVRVKIDLTERSVDFAGEWDRWRNRAARTRLRDDTGRRYIITDASGADDETVEPGGSRRGQLVFEASAEGERPESMRLYYPIGVDGRVVLELPIELRR